MKKQVLAAFGLLTGLLLAVSCQKANDKNPNLLGKWQGTEWLRGGKASDSAAMVHFEFNDDGTYSAQLGEGYSEIGTWRTAADKLYTVAQGKQEIMVKLLKYDGLVLSFEMNRQGTKEVLTMAKQ